MVLFARAMSQFLRGYVYSNKMQKTISVWVRCLSAVRLWFDVAAQVQSIRRHPKYKRYIRSARKIFAHDECNLS